MSRQQIAVQVLPDGHIQARQWSNDATVDGRVETSKLDAELIRLFEGWLSERGRAWTDDEIRVFGTLLHRALFPAEVWTWIQDRIDHRGDDIVGISLSFPADGAGSQLASVPWEYLYVPERNRTRGYFLANEPGIVLSRYVPSGVPVPAAPPMAGVLPVVADADPVRLGPVDAEPVLAAIRETVEPLGFSLVETLINPTAARFDACVAESRPTLVHFMGHGSFDQVTGIGTIAVSAPDGGTEWISAVQLGRLIGRPGSVPRVVILHACDGGRLDFRFRFAGLAPELLRNGVHCVIAMQYAITNETAIAFSTALYDEMGRGHSLDVAVQTCRQRLADQLRTSPQLLGIPMIYLSSSDPIWAIEPAATAEGTTP